MAVEERAERRGVAQTAQLGLAQGTLEALGIDHGCQIEQRARGGGDRDSVDDGALVISQSAVVNSDARACASPTRNGDLWLGRVAHAKAPRSGGRAVAEHRSGTAGEHGGHGASLTRQHSVTDGVDAAVKPMEPFALEPATDGARSDAESEQLPAGDDAMLPLGKGRDGPIELETAR